MQWIKASEPPKESGRYWCFVEELTDLGFSYYQWNCAYSAEDNTWSDNFQPKHVTHWMPLAKWPSEISGKSESTHAPEITVEWIENRIIENFEGIDQGFIDAAEAIHSAIAEQMAEKDKKLQQQETNELYLRASWDTTCQQRDELKNQVKALGAIKRGMEKSLTDAQNQLAAKEKEVEKLKELLECSVKSHKALLARVNLFKPDEAEILSNREWEEFKQQHNLK